MRGDQRLHRHGVFFHEIGDARIGVDHQLIGQPAIAFLIELAFENEALSKRPVLIHQRHADG
ncbi:hypothetical protein D3C72_2545250 [compost metagenome]